MKKMKTYYVKPVAELIRVSTRQMIMTSGTVTGGGGGSLDNGGDASVAGNGGSASDSGNPPMHSGTYLWDTDNTDY